MLTSGIEKSFDRATVRKIVEDHWRERFPLRGYGVRTQNITLVEQMDNRFLGEMQAWINSLPPDQGKELCDMFNEESRISISEGERDPVAYAIRLGVLSGPPSVEKSFDRTKVKNIVEDHFRAVLPLRGYGVRAQNITLIDQMENRFADQNDAWISSLPPDQAKELYDMFAEEMRSSVAECKRDPIAYARRLGVLPGRVYQRQGIGEMAVQTAVRASIWEGIFRLFGGDFFTVVRRSPPYQGRDSRNGNRQVARESETGVGGRIVRPFRRDRAQPDYGIRAPDDEPNTGSRRTTERHRRAGFGFHLTASAVSATTRRLVTLRLGERFACRFGSDHVANFPQHLIRGESREWRTPLTNGGPRFRLPGKVHSVPRGGGQCRSSRL